MECKFCGKECKTEMSLIQHQIYCKDNPDEKVQERLRKQRERSIKNGSGNRLGEHRRKTLKKIECDLCGKMVDSRQIDRHIGSKVCENFNKPKMKNNGNVKPKSEKWYMAMEKMKGKNARNQYTKADELGLPKPKMSDETKKKLSESAKKQCETMWTEEQREKHSNSMLKAVENNPESYSTQNVCGRVKQVEYNGTVFKSKWEVRTAEWFDKQLVDWEYEPKYFDYVWENKKRKYFPDFYLKEYDVYVEVKGYKRESDDAKWNQFPERLVLIDERNIDKLNEMKIEDLIGL